MKSFTLQQSLISPRLSLPSDAAAAASKGGPPLPLWLGWLLLSLVAFQTTAHNVSVRVSRGIYHEQYLVLTSMAMTELLKLSFCLLVVTRMCGWSPSRVIERLWRVLTPSNSIRMAVPASIFIMQSQLTFFGLNRLDTATYLAISQLKLLATAIFSVLMLNKRINTRQWRALLLLFIGVIAVQASVTTSQPTPAPATTTTAAAPSSSSILATWLPALALFDGWLGILSALGAAVCSGLSSVYFEYSLKAQLGEFDLWDRNIQLSMYGLLLNALQIAVIPDQRTAFFSHPLLFGFTWLSWTVVALHGFGGILVALVTLKLDNIHKNFGVAASVVMTGFVSAVLFRERAIDTSFVCGLASVTLAIMNYVDAADLDSGSTALAAQQQQQQQQQRVLEEQADGLLESEGGDRGKQQRVMESGVSDKSSHSAAEVEVGDDTVPLLPNSTQHDRTLKMQNGA